MSIKILDKKIVNDDNFVENVGRKIIYTKNEVEYVKIYKGFDITFETSFMSIKLLFKLFDLTSFKTPFIRINKNTKIFLMKELGYKNINSIQKLIKKVVDKNYLIRYSIGVYYLNPSLFWNGSEKNKKEFFDKLESGDYIV